MNIQHNDKLRDRLSAAYVLGTLRGGARRRFESYLKDSALIQREVGQWQDRLHPMAEFAGGIKPPARVWAAIERHIKGARIESSNSRWAFWINLHNDLAFWRGLGLVSTTAAAILVAIPGGIPLNTRSLKKRVFFRRSAINLLATIGSTMRSS